MQSTNEKPIRITGIIEEEIGVPRNDGTRGSALYAVPFQLSREPSPEWASIFVQTWDHPPKFTSMHRPGIARVVGHTIILDRTTLDEVEQYHKQTLLLVVSETNRKVQEYEAERHREQELEKARLQRHREHVSKAARRVKFD